MLSQPYRFHGHGSLRYVYKHGKTERNRTLTLKYSKNPHRKRPRVAVIIGKKVIKSAVKRNRVRRRIYEVIRLELPRIKEPYDIALTVYSPEALVMPAPELKVQVVSLLEQAGIV
ncbi:MAG TPA: ribonuclease P protein component [Verrucomicrobiae bacterium]|nr:ribonuclease P protein component [Verrucomicrobiae bacterium]